MEIKILGPGCQKCKTLDKMTREAVSELGIAAQVEKEEDIMKIMEYGIMQTPGLLINGKVIFSGRLPSTKELKEIITNNQ